MIITTKFCLKSKIAREVAKDFLMTMKRIVENFDKLILKNVLKNFDSIASTEKIESFNDDVDEIDDDKVNRLDKII